MKQRSWIFISAFLAATMILGAGHTLYEKQEAPNFPEEVEKLLKNSCWGCHNTESNNDDAKSALDLSLWNEYGLAKKIGLLNEIDDVLEEGMMPPQRFVRRYPERALSDDQVKLIRDWTRQETKKLMK
jgi:hypothetical protein